MANGTPTWSGTDSCGSKTSIGNIGSTVDGAWNQFLTHISSNQNTNVSTLKWYITGGDWSVIQNGCPVLYDLPNFYQYYTRFFIQSSNLGFFQTWTELLDAVNNASIIMTTLTPTMGWEEVQDLLFDGNLQHHIVPQMNICSCVGSISWGSDVSGCMNPTATNYNPLATIDDGSCIGGLVPGCCDPSATNYDPLATCNDGSCEYNGGGGCLTCGTGGDDSVPGCCDLVADNYDPLATCNDGSCQYTFDSWNCDECATLVNCDGWNGLSGHLPIMSHQSNPTPRTDTGITVTTYDEAQEWYFANPTVSWSQTYFKVMSSTLTSPTTTYFINGVDWTGGAWGHLGWLSINLFDHSNGQYGISLQDGPMTPLFVGGGGTAENVINYYMGEGLPVSQGMTWQEFKVVVTWHGYFPGHVYRKANCCMQGTGFTCGQAVGGSYATQQECIDAGCGTV